MSFQIIIAISVLEIICFILLKTSMIERQTLIINKNRTEESFNDESVLIFDKSMGRKPKSNISIQEIQKENGKTIIDYVFNTDNFNRRITPYLTQMNRNSFLLFFGGSYTWGTVDDNMTIPWLVSECQSVFNTYNYAVGGYGTQHMLAKLQNYNLQDEVNEKNGYLIYIFIPQHVNRVIGDLKCHNSFTKYHPYYYLDNDSLIRNKTFNDGRKYISFLYKLLWKSNIIKYFNIDLPRLSDNHIYLTYKIILESKNIFVFIILVILKY